MAARAFLEPCGPTRLSGLDGAHPAPHDLGRHLASHARAWSRRESEALHVSGIAGDDERESAGQAAAAPALA